MADLTTQSIPIDLGETDLVSSLTAAGASGDTAEVGEGIFLVVNNGDASSHTATIDVSRTIKGLSITDGSLVVGAGNIGIIPLNGIFRGTDGRASITYDDVTSVTVGVFKLQS